MSQPLRIILTVAALFLLPCTTAFAGAWPQEKGKLFLSLNQAISRDGKGRPDGYRSLYLEYGVTRKLTFGVTMWQRADRRYGNIMAFARYPVGNPDSAHKFALGFALGVRAYGDGTSIPVVQTEAAWGKGFQSRLGDGWMSLDAAAGQTIGRDDIWLKLDFTLGLKPDDKTHLIMQLRGFDGNRGRVATLSPSYVRHINQRLKLEIGVTYRLAGRNRMGALIGSWIEF